MKSTDSDKYTDASETLTAASHRADCVITVMESIGDRAQLHMVSM